MAPPAPLPESEGSTARPPRRRSLRLRLGVAYLVAAVVTTLALAIYRDLAHASKVEGGVMRLYGELREEATIRRLPWLGSAEELDRWVRAFAVDAQSDSIGRKLVQVSVVDGDGKVLGSAGPGRLPLGAHLGERLGPEAGRVLGEVFAFPVQCSDPPERSYRDFRLKDGSERLPNGHDLAIVAVQDDENAYIYGAVVRELEPTLLGNLQPLAGGLVRAAPAPLLSGLLLIALLFQTVVRRLERLSAGAREWSRGNLAVRVAPGPPDELARLAEDLNAMARRLDDLLRTREDQAARGERDRLARDLHDAVKQQLFAAKLHLAVAQRYERDGGELDTRAGARALSDAQALVETALYELSGLLAELRPPVPLDLGAALDLEATLWSRGSGLPIRTRIELGVDSEPNAPPRAKEALLRVLQEALANVARHSDADTVEVRLARQEDDLALSVADDGRGFDLAAAGGGLGLTNMRDRLREVGGRLRIESTIGQGTTVHSLVPLSGPSAASDLPGAKP